MCEEIDDIIDVENILENTVLNTNSLTDKIFNYIDSSLLFICDITPDLILDLVTNQSKTKNFDDINKLVSLPNPNVMLELGYYMQQKSNYNIILLCDETKTNKNSNLIPSMLRGQEITYYDSSVIDHHIDIIEKINSLKQSIEISFEETKSKWIKYIYNLSDSFLLALDDLLDIKRKEYYIIFNKQYKKSLIIINGYNSKINSRKINIGTKKLYLRNREICLSKFPNIYKELQHLELVLMFEFMD